MLLGVVLPALDSINADMNINSDNGFEKGVTWQPFEAMKRTTFVNFDKDTLIDDYAYLSSIPASVFSDGDKIYSSPLLFFQQEGLYPTEDKYRFLNDYMGTHYLMEDWMGYCKGKLDKLITINVDEQELETEWRTNNHVAIDSDNPFEIASKIALEDWSYSDEAILAVIEKEYETPEGTEFSNTVEGSVSGEIGRDSFKIKRPFGPASEYEGFTIEPEYKYVEVDLWYPAIVYYSKLVGAVPGFANPTKITLPSVDPDLQLYCNFENEWIQTSLSASMAITKGPHEEVLSYVYYPGDWKVGVTCMPTEGGDDPFIKPGPLGKTDIYGSLTDALKSLSKGVSNLNVDVTKYPGIEIEIPDTPPFGCRDGVFELTWDNENVNLGLTIIGPSGEELDNIMDQTDECKQEIEIKYLGECLENEHYKAVVYALEDISMPIDFEVKYSWQQNISKKEADMLSSACQGAVLASIENCPLLYITSDSISSCIEDTLLKLGVEKVTIIDLGGYLNKDTRDIISDIAKIKNEYKEYQEIYDVIKGKTDSNDIVFSTIDPWSYWYYKEPAGELKADGEYKEAFHFAPAAYAAAHHGTPVLLVDNHAELSSSLTWHANFWNKYASGFKTPNVACMYITGTRIYDFLDKIGFDKQGDESILTVAGQYEIGPSWSRIFAGVANPGDIMGTPVDASNHITRCIFYPGLIFENPAMQDEVTLINGSVSKRVFHMDHILRPFEVLLARLSKDTPGLTNLKIIRESGTEEFKYPVLHSFVCYCHRVNERGSKYWGISYKTRRGYTPNEDISGLEIDEGVREIFEGKAGSFLPDLSPTVYTPFYAAKAGYSNAFSTGFDEVMFNMNQGLISCYFVLHGVGNQGGWFSWPEPISEWMGGMPNAVKNLVDKGFGLVTGSNPHEVNPWRGYEMWWGSTEEPDSAILNSEIGIIQGWTNAIRPRDLLNKGILKTGLDIVPTHLAGYYDGQVGPYSITGMMGKSHYSHPATEIDDTLGNIHSMGFHAGSCLVGSKYIQIVFLRHGSVAQEMDPWSTSYWSSYMIQQIPKEFALGKTIGESYSHGITEVGPQYVFDDDDPRIWWWDSTENVVLYADPDLRIWVPSTEYDPKGLNHWDEDDFTPLTYDEEFNINGHMPFGATSYPNEKQPASMLVKYMPLILVIIVIILLLIAVAMSKGKRKK